MAHPHVPPPAAMTTRRIPPARVGTARTLARRARCAGNTATCRAKRLTSAVRPLRAPAAPLPRAGIESGLGPSARSPQAAPLLAPAYGAEREALLGAETHGA